MSLKSKLAQKSKQLQHEAENTTPTQAVAAIDEKVLTQVLQLLEIQKENEEIEEGLADFSKDEKSAAFALLKENRASMKEIADSGKDLRGAIWSNFNEVLRLAGSAEEACAVKKKVRR